MKLFGVALPNNTAGITLCSLSVSTATRKNSDYFPNFLFPMAMGEEVTHEQKHPLPQPPIGESLLHILQQNDRGKFPEEVPDSSKNDEGGQKNDHHQISNGNSIYRSTVLLHRAIINNEEGNNFQDDAIHSRKRSRILLCGPSKSGKSSLAMNLAYTKASLVSPCLCLDSRMCHCIAVTMYVPAFPTSTTSTPASGATEALTSSLRNDDNFPLPCRRVDKGRAGDELCVLDWDPRILKRIRVNWVASVHELLQNLLEMLGKPLQERPRSGGAIIIDDLDLIVSKDPNISRISHSNAHRNTTTSAILQTSECFVLFKFEKGSI